MGATSSDLAQHLLELLVNDAGVRFAAGGFHHLTDQEADCPLLPLFKVLHSGGVFRNHFSHNFFASASLVADLGQALLLHNFLRALA